MAFTKISIITYKNLKSDPVFIRICVSSCFQWDFFIKSEIPV